MTKADEIREYVTRRYVEPARATGVSRISVRAGDIHREMSLKDRMPAVTSALGAKLFEQVGRVKCVSRTGPHSGASLTFEFQILP